MEMPDEEQSEIWRKDSNNWVWGIFYFNPKDKRIFPPKRFKYTGWTINFGNPVSVWGFIFSLMAVFCLIKLFGGKM